MSATLVMTAHHGREDHVSVERGDEGAVWVKVVQEDGSMDLTIAPDVARALAAVLVHYATEAER